MEGRLIVNGCNRGGWYLQGQHRLMESLVHNSKAPFRRWGYQTPYPHRDPRNYWIKSNVLWEAKKYGRMILWMDCSMWAVKNIDKIFDIIEDRGYFIMNNPGWNSGQWSSDILLQYFRLTRDQAMQIPHCMTGLIGIDTTRHQALLHNFNWMGERGYFEGDWTNENHQVSKDDRCLGHRQDQAVYSLMLWKKQMLEWEDPSKWVYFPKKDDNSTFEQPICCQGM